MRGSTLVLALVLATSTVAAPARAQTADASTSDAAVPVGASVSEGESAVASEAESESESTVASESEGESEGESESEPHPTLVPGIADERLAEVDDGIDELFSGWVSERLFTGPTPSGSSLMLLTELGVRFGITRDSRARVDWGFAYTSSHVQGTFMDTTTTSMTYDAQVERVEARNPVLSLEWAPVINDMRFSFGAGVAMPTAAGENLPTNVSQAAAYDASSITHELMLATAGGLAPWRYRRERMGVFIPLSFTFPFEQLTIAIDAAAAISAPVTGAGRGVPVTGDLQADVQLSGDLIPEVRLGARFGIALLDIGANVAPGTIVQPSATGYLRVRLDPGFLIASVLADLGGHYGLNSSGGVWSATIGGGASLP